VLPAPRQLHGDTFPRPTATPDTLRGRDPRGTLDAWTRRRTRMKRKKWTPDEWRAYKAAREGRIRELREYVERAKAELAAKRKEKPA
jgi:hypothetical protein